MTRTALIKHCLKLQKQKKGVASYLKAEGYSNKEIVDIQQDIQGKRKQFKTKAAKIELEDDRSWKTGLKFTKKYVYNKEDDKYVMYLKAANNNIVLPGDTVRGIVKNYSNWCGKEHSINELCRNYKIPRAYFNDLRDNL